MQRVSTRWRACCRAVGDVEDREARFAMHLASVFAGIGFGNAGVHLWYAPPTSLSRVPRSRHAAKTPLIM